jgi:hypothetical protein
MSIDMDQRTLHRDENCRRFGNPTSPDATAIRVLIQTNALKSQRDCSSQNGDLLRSRYGWLHPQAQRPNIDVIAGIAMPKGLRILYLQPQNDLDEGKSSAVGTTK